MDESMHVEIVLGRQKIKAASIPIADKARIIRSLSDQNALRGLPGHLPISDLLHRRPTKQGRSIKRAQPQGFTLDTELAYKEELLQISRFHERRGDGYDELILYSARDGGLVLWDGHFINPSEEYEERHSRLKLTLLTNESLASLIATDGRFERIIEDIRVLLRDAIRHYEDRVRYLRDNFRFAAETQRRLGYYPQDCLRD